MQRHGAVHLRMDNDILRHQSIDHHVRILPEICDVVELLISMDLVVYRVANGVGNWQAK